MLPKEDALINEALLPEDVIHWSQAKNHIGENVSIYGEVASTFFNWKEYERFVGCKIDALQVQRVEIPPALA